MEQIKADVCMLLNNQMTHDSRVLREATTLAQSGWKVVVVAHYVQRGVDNLPLMETINGFDIYRFPIKHNMLLDELMIRRVGVLYVFRLYHLLHNIIPLQRIADWWFHRTNYLWTKQFRTLSKVIKNVEANIFHVHDYPNLLLLSLAFPVKGKIVYDSHEVYFDRVSGQRSQLQDALNSPGRNIEKDLAKHCEAVITVGDKIADHLVETLGIKRPVVLRNVVDLRQIATQPAQIFPTENYRIVVHSGGISYGRRLQELVQSMQYLPDDVAFVFVGSGPLEDELIAIATAQRTNDRLFILPSVQPHEVSATIAQGDVAIVSADPTTGLNGQYSLPNKYFEAIAAGLPVVTSQAIEIVQLTEQYEIGVSVDVQDPQAIAQGILDILEPEHYEVYRQNVEKARRILNWETEEKKLIQLYESLRY